MNPFVNPKKRSVSLPSGCKELIDVLERPDKSHESTARWLIYMALFQAQQHNATDMVIGATPNSGGTPIRYKVEDTWYDISPIPSQIRPDVIEELARMANVPAGQFPAEGVLDVDYADVRLRWKVAMMSSDGECLLARIQD
jgi:hypothetical protein